MDYRKIKELAKRADRAKGEERKRLVENLIRELPKLDPFDGRNESTIRIAKLLAETKWVDSNEFSNDLTILT